MNAAPPGRPSASAPGTSMTPRHAGSRPPAATGLGGMSAAAAVAAALMAVAHAGVRLPLVSALGPGGDRAVWPAALVFAAGALTYAGLAVGAFAARRWVWPVGLVINALSAIAMVRPFRGAASALGLALFVGALLVLLSPAGRRAFDR